MLRASLDLNLFEAHVKQLTKFKFWISSISWRHSLCLHTSSNSICHHIPMLQVENIMPPLVVFMTSSSTWGNLKWLLITVEFSGCTERKIKRQKWSVREHGIKCWHQSDKKKFIQQHIKTGVKDRILVKWKITEKECIESLQ